MSTLFDIFGFLSVVLHGVELVAQSVLLGSVAFSAFVVPAAAADVAHEWGVVQASCRRVILAAVVAAMVSVLAATGVNAVVLASSLPMTWRDVAGAAFVVAAGVQVLAAAAIGAMLWRRRSPSASTRLAACAAGVIFLCAALANTHAVARLADNGVLLLATAAHELGSALWLGGLPCFWMALRLADGGKLGSRIGRRFSALAIGGVALIVAGAAVFVYFYMGSFAAVYGTAYGAMAVTKSILLGMLLLLGLANFLTVRRMPGDVAAARRVGHFVELEMGIGVAVLMAAASITSMPPAVDLVEDRVSWAEIAQRMRPTLPRLTSPDHAQLALSTLQAKLDEEAKAGRQSTHLHAYVPGGGALPPRNAEDIAWSEYNHHWAGLLVLLMGLAALAQRSGRAAWAKHWPLLFLLLAAFLLLRADPEVWPMGKIGIIESLKDPEVLQHRLFVLLIVAFALFEWRVRTARRVSAWRLRVFPLLTALGGTLLLTHSHALGNIKEQTLVDLTHLPIAILGVGAGWARWLEVEAPRTQGRWAAWVWPVCFVLIGLLLLDYREA